MARSGGWRRRGRKTSFRYEDARGRAITDEDRLERIAALAIPPAWKDVWISPVASAKLQATGVDAAGRRQYLYHPDYRAAQERSKYDRLVRFGELLPALRGDVSRDSSGVPLSHDWTAAHAVTLINRAWFRVGSERYAKTSRTYGVTTLRKRHVNVRGNRLTFTFRAKHGSLNRTTLVDEELAAAVRTLLELPGGSRLFRIVEDGSAVDFTGAMLNAYLGEHLGEGFTAKDFRTWGGSLTAAIALAEHGPPESDSEGRKAIAAAMRRVGKELGNTPAVARSSYVSPAVTEQFLDGRTLESFRDRRRRSLSAHERGLDPEERALLTLLRSWRIRRAS
jgi:DNA topoisomerase-1